MMNQQIDLLKSILFAEWTTLVTFGICLLVLQKQKKPAYQLYTRARQLLAINFLIFAMEPFLYWLSFFPLHRNYYRWNIQTDQPYNCNSGSLNNGYSFGNPFLQLLSKGSTKDG